MDRDGQNIALGLKGTEWETVNLIRGRRFGRRRVGVRGKCQTFQSFQERSGDSGLDFQGAVEAALTEPELGFAIDLLRKRARHLGSFSHDGPMNLGVSPSPIPRSFSADPLPAEVEGLRRQISELEAQLEEMESLRTENGDQRTQFDETATQLRQVRDENERLRSELGAARAELEEMRKPVQLSPIPEVRPGEKITLHDSANDPVMERTRRLLNKRKK
jgi:hypothetical protein